MGPTGLQSIAEGYLDLWEYDIVIINEKSCDLRTYFLFRDPTQDEKACKYMSD